MVVIGDKIPENLSQIETTLQIEGSLTMSTRPKNLSVEGKYKMDIRQETAGKQGRPQEQISKSRKTENASHSKPKVGPGPWGLGWHVIDVSIIDSIFGTVPEDGRQY